MPRARTSCPYLHFIVSLAPLGASLDDCAVSQEYNIGSKWSFYHAYREMYPGQPEDVAPLAENSVGVIGMSKRLETRVSGIFRPSH